MPFYEYQCFACGHRHEELQKISDGPLRKCPDCGRNTLKRLISAPAFRLKGGGWYETDFKADKENQRNLAGDKEPVAEKPKEKEAGAAATAATDATAGTAATDATAKPGDAAKAAPAAEKPSAGAKPPPARKKTARRRVRK